MPQIILCQENEILTCSKGENLYQVLASHGFLDAPCGGVGCCGKCRVRIIGSALPAPQATETTFLTPAEQEAGWRLACLYAVTEDIIVELPQSQQVVEIISTGYCRPFTVQPEIQKRLDGEGNTVVWQNKEIIAMETGDHTRNYYGVAIDIGTTTVVASFIDFTTGQEMASLSCLNSQKAFGQDVISRIHYASSNGLGGAILQKTILQDIHFLLEDFLTERHLAPCDLVAITIAANTTMVHLLAGQPVASLGSFPYSPAFYGPWRVKGADWQLPVASYCPVYCLPAVAAFVGGDITAGILACGLQETAENILFLDIGTNGEMVLAKEGQLYACACAAGPALEGMNISCGMRAAQGAIEDVTILGEEVAYTTIGGGMPSGLCGSGLLAVVAELRRADILQKSGRLREHPLVETVGGKKRFVLDETYGIFLTQQDIRHVQLAKGAILAGIYALLAATGLALAQVDKVLVAGQFGAHLKANSLTGAGLLPSELGDRISYVGNTAKSGAVMCLLSAEQRSQVEDIAEKVNYLELSTLDGYNDLFVKCMEF